MEVPRQNLELGRDSFSFGGPLVWNCLDKKARECANIDKFKRLLKTSSNKTALQKVSFIKGTGMNNNNDLDNFVYF